MNIRKRLIFSCVILLGLGTFVYRCTSTSALDTIKERGKLIAAVRNVPTVYYEGAHELAGFEYELLRDFADHLGVELELKVVYSIPELFQVIEDGTCDIGSGAITRTKDREKKYLFGPDYYDVKQVVVYKSGTRAPKSVDDLQDGILEIVGNSSYEENLIKLKQNSPKLEWINNPKLSTDQLLEKVWKGKIDYTVADDNIAQINQRYFPELEIGIPLTEEESLAWVLNKNLRGLSSLIDEWLEEYKLTQKLEDLIQRYYTHVHLFDYVDIRKYHNRIKTRLPEYSELFKEAGETYDIPWTLLAAQAYQESHWSVNAKSPTGVRGMMMLTLTTAKKMGVSNRLDARESIMGGAKYMAQLLKAVPESVQESDKLIYALATYNVGMGHMKDVRILTERLGLDKNRWLDLKTTLPFLSQKQFYQTLKHGYARGSEPVRYVNQIHDYRDILENILASQTN
jgi:membrane-bound lytic murein transglycosylase F